MLEAARLFDLEKIIYISSVAAFAVKRYEPLNEDHPIFDSRCGHPAEPCGAFKAAAEIFGLTYWNVHDVDFVSVQPSLQP